MSHIELMTKGESDPAAPPEGFNRAAAAAYEPSIRKVNFATPDKPPEGQQEDDALPPDFQKKIDAAVNGAVRDAESGKFSPAGKKAWQDLIDYMKTDQPAGNQLTQALNVLSAQANEMLLADGSKNSIAAQAVADSKGISFYMMLNGPNTADQNSLDAVMGHESDTVFRAGRIERPKPNASTAP